MKITCKQAFKDGHMERKKYPLCNGEYKLKEALYDVVGSLNELDRIADYKRARGDWARREKGHALCHCTTEDMGKWLKALPQYIAFTLSFNVIPATLALTGDGVSAVDARGVHLETRSYAEQLVRDLGSASSSTLYPLVADTVRLIESALANAQSMIMLAPINRNANHSYHHL